MTTNGVPVAPTEETPLLTEDAVVDAPQLDRPRNPAMASKMHLILPAIGIGVGTFIRNYRLLMSGQIYLVAVDGVLTAASYAKMGNDLNALNNMSWVATSCVFLPPVCFF